MNINDLATRVYEQNKAVGWWDDPDRCIYTTLMLIVSELGEAMEGHRKDLMDDHLPHRKAAEVELADALIRLVDLGGRYGWGYCESNQRYDNRLDCRPDSYPAQLLVISGQMNKLSNDAEVVGPNTAIAGAQYRCAVNTILEVANRQGFDLENAVEEKLEFNRTRADHKREARSQPGGKAY